MFRDYTLYFKLLPCLLGIISGSSLAQTSWQSPVISSQQQAVTIQKQIDELDQQTQSDWQNYQSVMNEIRQLEKYNSNLQRLIDEQDQQIAVLEEKKQSLLRTEKTLQPLLYQMYEGLMEWYAADPYFLNEERGARRSNVKMIIEDADKSLSQKYEAVLSAYSIESNYNKMLLTWTGQVEHLSPPLSAQFLAVGRIGRYFVTPDGSKGGSWDSEHKRWVELSKSQRQDVLEAINVATQQKPEHVIAVPMLMQEQQ